ncbi:MAG: hypothetical protein V2I36_11365 [Desulfopila sp.]|jgi:hypothetical protein|nr:hypothetical protein [Desulfopila sp.]
MKRRCIHQWRDWLLEYSEEGKYEFIQKDNQAVVTITAKNDMDAENQCRQIIKSGKKKEVEQPPLKGQSGQV